MYGSKFQLSDFKLKSFFNVQETFNQRVKNYNTWTNSQKTLQGKRDTEAKMQTTGKTEKLPQVQAEIQDVGVVTGY